MGDACILEVGGFPSLNGLKNPFARWVYVNIVYKFSVYRRKE